ncbi:MAG TPA: hypothetical protein VF972_01565 [Actinomycetota bacterium]
MAKDAAIVISWGGGVAGREAKGIEVFMDALTFWGKQAADEKCEQPEPFLAEDGSGGMLIIKGKSDALREITESDDGLMLIAKAQLIVQDLKSHWYFAGDQEIQTETARYAQAGNELGYM